MDNIQFGAFVAQLRKEQELTQKELADRLNVTDKAVSKWETGKGFPDVKLLEPLAQALDISVIELFSGENIRNQNRAGNMLRERFYVCPVCGNVIQASGEAVISCCGITLPPLEAEDPDEEHLLRIEEVEDEYFVTVEHPMTKAHYLSFFAALSDQGAQLVKLYPEGSAEARFKRNRVKWLLTYCNHHGLFRVKV